MPLDTYTLNARVYPALIAGLPIAASSFAVYPDQFGAVNQLLRIAVYCGGVIVLGTIARTAGKRIEPKLFKRWGGEPTTIRLRHRTVDGNEALRTHRHRQLTRLFPDISLPTRQQEEEEPQGADSKYRAVVARLRGATRDRAKYPLVFSENCGYGFLRNLSGLRVYGVIVALAAIAFLGWHLRPNASTTGTPVVVFAFGLSILLALFWLFYPTQRRIRLVGFAYADALLECCEALESAKGNGTT
jgi:hypothetical protein